MARLVVCADRTFTSPRAMSTTQPVLSVENMLERLSQLEKRTNEHTALVTQMTTDRETDRGEIVRLSEELGRIRDEKDHVVKEVKTLKILLQNHTATRQVMSMKIGGHWVRQSLTEPEQATRERGWCWVWSQVCTGLM